MGVRIKVDRRKNYMPKDVLIIIMSIWAVFLLVEGLGCQMPASQERSPIVELLAKLMPESPTERRQKLLDNLSSIDADLRRQGVKQLGQAEAATWEATPKILRIMALGDESAQVRTAALAVLGQIADTETLLAVAQKTAQDQHVMVRRETVAVLGQVQSDGSLTILRDRLEEDSDPEVRAAAAGALGAYHDIRAVRALLEGLADDEFAVSYRAQESLHRLTGKDFGYDRSAWESWLYSANKVFEDGKD